jgi:hypothetical protein
MIALKIGVKDLECVCSTPYTCLDPIPVIALLFEDDVFGRLFDGDRSIA